MNDDNFWGDGRVGRILKVGDHYGRHVLVVPEFEDNSRFAMYIESDDLSESFWDHDAIHHVLRDLKVEWLDRGDRETRLERELFDIRDSYIGDKVPTKRTTSNSLVGRVIRYLKRNDKA